MTNPSNEGTVPAKDAMQVLGYVFAIKDADKNTPNRGLFETIEAKVTSFRIVPKTQGSVYDAHGSWGFDSGCRTQLFSIEHPRVKTLSYFGPCIPVRPGDVISTEIFLGGRTNIEKYNMLLKQIIRRDLSEIEVITSFKGRTPEGLWYSVE
jgi:hypothetical protein